jgi:hypothetical protein
MKCWKVRARCVDEESGSVENLFERPVASSRTPAFASAGLCSPPLCLPFRLREHVSDAGDSEYERGVGWVVFDLGTQVLDVNVYGTAVGGDFSIGPEIVANCRAAQSLTWIPCKQEEEIELASRQ